MGEEASLRTLVGEQDRVRAGLPSSPFFKGRHDGRALPACDRWADTLVRLPMYHDLSDGEARWVAGLVMEAL